MAGQGFVKKSNFGLSPSVLDDSDVAMAKTLGLLRSDIVFQDSDPDKQVYGVAYSRREHVASEPHGTQKAIQARCKELAEACGFPIAHGKLQQQVKRGNTRTQDVATLTTLVETEMLPRYDGKTDKMTRAAISSFLLGKRHKVARSAVSRIKGILMSVFAVTVWTATRNSRAIFD
ncbi:hypothetical protein JG688_00014118 [Phytophthora aleatoria]|uniref:Uncharacterized protein n=1 Tax=Phytophthora aleatoria TaxID=2496075 RepID=A0A8J5M3H4_9STRA|nr:hypothetical protein JG688_00014118 [Phytophthora aleatoria]